MSETQKDLKNTEYKEKNDLMLNSGKNEMLDKPNKNKGCCFS